MHDFGTAGLLLDNKALRSDCAQLIRPRRRSPGLIYFQIGLFELNAYEIMQVGVNLQTRWRLCLMEQPTAAGLKSTCKALRVLSQPFCRLKSKYMNAL